MAAMLVATAAPALPQVPPPPNCENGQGQAVENARDRQDFAQVAKHEENISDCEAGLPPGEGHDK
jgi:hypothetical protein